MLVYWRVSNIPFVICKHLELLYFPEAHLATLQETSTYPTKRENENHRLKSAFLEGTC